MPEYLIQGVRVDFPFDAYPCQKAYMEKVIQCLEESYKAAEQSYDEDVQIVDDNFLAKKCTKNALLEMPTGTGKSLCLLCSSLAWQRHMKQTKGSGPQIIFSSRTHTQLMHAVKELKRTPYKVSMAVLGSRDQLCIHPEVSQYKGQRINRSCNSMVRNHKCQYYENLKLSRFGMEDKVMDIEDLVEFGKDNDICPYFYSREMHKTADIVFMPYNYFIDNVVRKRLGLDFSGAVMIFDEAHNLDKWCCDGASFELSTMHIVKAIAEVQKAIYSLEKVMDIDDKMEVEENVDAEDAEKVKVVEKDTAGMREDFVKLKDALLDLDIFIDAIEIGAKGTTKSGNFIFDLISEMRLSSYTFDQFSKTVDEVVQVLNDSTNQLGVQSVRDAFAHLFGENVLSEEDVQSFFKVHINLSRMPVFISEQYKKIYIEELEVRNKKKDFSKIRSLNFWCFSPSVAFKRIIQNESKPPQCFIFTSGTLSPLDAFQAEFRLDFPFRLESNHVIGNDQISCIVATSGPMGTKFNSSYTNRDSEDYQSDIGILLVNISRSVPGGMLVFFQSYSMLEKCMNTFRKVKDGTSIYQRLDAIKKILIEPKDGSALQKCIADYEEIITQGKGAVFFAVCRGRVSEGMDFSDNKARSVCIVGVPFPPKEDPKVLLKEEFLDNLGTKLANKDIKPLTGKQWYASEMARAVNQAIGRVIRHRNDYGSIILCDERYANNSFKDQLSKWLRPYIQVKNFGDIVLSLNRFYKHAYKKYTLGEVQEAILVEDTPQLESVKPSIVNNSKPPMTRPVNIVNNNSINTSGLNRNSSTTSLPSVINKTAPPLNRNFTSFSINRPITNNNAPSNSASSISNSKTSPLNNKAIVLTTAENTSEKPPISKPISAPIVTSDEINANNNPSTNQADSSKPIATTPQTDTSAASKFVNEVKSALSTNDYLKFKTALRSFQQKSKNPQQSKTQALEEFSSTLKGIFTGNNSRFLHGLKSYIPEGFHSRFEKICGLSSPEEAKSEVIDITSNTSDTANNKRPRTDEYVDLVTGVKKRRSGGDSQNNSNSASQTAIIVPPQKLYVSDTIMEEAPPVTHNPLECSICKGNLMKPLAARCGHICCEECWKGWLVQKKECPICRAKTRDNQLVALHL